MSDNVQSLRPVGKTANEDVVNTLKRWLADAESGDLLNVTIIGDTAGNSYQYASIGPANRFELGAMLLERAIRDLGFITRKDLQEIFQK